MPAKLILTLDQVNWAIDCGLSSNEVAKELGISKSMAEKIFYGLTSYTSRRREKTKSLFTDDQIRSIRADTRMQKEIAEEYGCVHSLISGIKSYRYYGHVHGPDSRPSKKRGANRKLSIQQIMEIKDPANADKSLKWWALTYGVSITAVFNAKNGFTYEETNKERVVESEGA